MKTNYISFLMILLLFIGCKKDEIANPEATLLVFPFQNSECNTGISLSETLSQVTFEWEAAKNTELYILSVVNLNTNVPQTITTAAISASLTIEKGTPYSWTVTSSNSNTDSNNAISENWLFYNAGPQINYAPFPAQIITPVSGSTVQPNQNNETILHWIGADVEEDITNFEVYFSETNPPAAILASIDDNRMEVPVRISSGTTYYWSVITTDANGNTSDSGVHDFKAL